ncbi:hypothetical protein mflW37_3360 [Mesoplasma florum W37]|uniref:Uncharacterized protein n=1 Tax=Mesoplasma florum TaxID=2151 RepID=A0AAD0HT20_MESFO|nr:hypothetical protein [Mesoplasma florum]AGY41403.1 hypothetical protein mflW37_3360 [Mesoplasma florum W37]AVN59623.1 hypothetical protein CG008_01750 [Mesoplasma florum]AVN65744.1 hypothetical protein MflW12_3390 [Mesoplasma florum]
MFFLLTLGLIIAFIVLISLIVKNNKLKKQKNELHSKIEKYKQDNNKLKKNNEKLKMINNESTNDFYEKKINRKSNFTNINKHFEEKGQKIYREFCQEIRDSVDDKKTESERWFNYKWLKYRCQIDDKKLYEKINTHNGIYAMVIVPKMNVNELDIKHVSYFPIYIGKTSREGFIHRIKEHISGINDAINLIKEDDKQINCNFEELKISLDYKADKIYKKYYEIARFLIDNPVDENEIKLNSNIYFKILESKKYDKRDIKNSQTHDIISWNKFGKSLNDVESEYIKKYDTHILGMNSEVLIKRNKSYKKTNMKKTRRNNF